MFQATFPVTWSKVWGCRTCNYVTCKLIQISYCRWNFLGKNVLNSRSFFSIGGSLGTGLWAPLCCTPREMWPRLARRSLNRALSCPHARPAPSHWQRWTPSWTEWPWSPRRRTRRPSSPGSFRGRPAGSLGPRPKTNPSVDRFQYRVILEAIYAPDEVWGRD